MKRTDASYPYRGTGSVKAAVKVAQAEYLGGNLSHRGGTQRQSNMVCVSISYFNIIPDIGSS
jgi:hypothetical protein